MASNATRKEGVNMKVKLIAHTPKPEQLCAAAAKSCHSIEYPGRLSYTEVKKILQKVKAPGQYKEVDQKSLLEYLKIPKREISEGEAEKIIEMVRALGHHSVLEHATFTYSIEGISRACSHQLVRHRIASYSQQSQRYILIEKFSPTIPPSIAKKRQAKEIYEKAMTISSETYRELIDLNIPLEDARYVLPNASTTNIVVSMNARALLIFFELRTCLKAQWEIRKMANLMLKEVKKIAPILFENAGPLCKSRGICPENDKTCKFYPKNKFIRQKGGNNIQ
jgi:thymidylate synthase (FAD)